MAVGLARLEPAARPVFAAAHLPMTGEWIAPPALRSAGAGPAAPSPGGHGQALRPTVKPLENRFLRYAQERMGSDFQGGSDASRSGAPAQLPR